jgi:hypothetical protein
VNVKYTVVILLLVIVVGWCTFVSEESPEGSINDVVFQHLDGVRSALIVYGTQNPDPSGTDTDMRTAYRIRDLIEDVIGSEIEVKADTEVTEADIQEYNLMLYGGPVANSIMAEINDDLPIQFAFRGGEWCIVAGERMITGEDTGVIMACPNPLNPDNYVLIYAGVTRIGTTNANNVHHGPTDYVIFNRDSWEKRLEGEPAPALMEGFFDKSDPYHWAMEEE